MAFIAASLASLLQPWRSWCPSLMLTAMLFLLLAAIPACFFANGRDRAFYFGFAIVGWGYFLVVHTLVFDASVGRQLLTNHFAEFVCIAVTGSLGDIQQFLNVSHTLFTFGFAYAGAVATERGHASVGKVSSTSKVQELRAPRSNELSLRRTL